MRKVGRANIYAPTRYRESNPRRGDPIWVRDRLMRRKQPNGYIEEVMWEEQEVLVRFWDNDLDTFTFDDLEGNWTDKFWDYGGYMLQGEP